MKKILSRVFTCSALFLLLSACATSPNVKLDPDFWQQTQSVKVSNDHIDHAGLYHMGSQGLLDVAISDIATDTFSKYLKTYSLKKLYSIRPEFVRRLKNHHLRTEAFPTIDVDKLPWTNLKGEQFSNRNFSEFSAKIGKSKLMVVSVNMVGAMRSYYGFIPLGAPKAVCILEGRLLNAKTNRILWRYTSKVVIPVNGKWDQPPHYPNFTHSLDRAIQLSRTQLIDNFFADRSE